MSDASLVSATDGSPKEERPDFLASFKLLRRYLPGSGLKLTGSIILATVSVFFELVPVWVVYRLVSAVIDGSATLDYFFLHAAITLAAVLLSAITQGFAAGLSHIVAFDTLHRLRMDMARHMSRLPLGYFASTRSGDAKKLVIDEPERLELVIAHGLPEGISALATWLAVSIWLFAVDWRMALAAVALTPISFALMSLAIANASGRAGEYQRANMRMNASIVEYLAGMPVVKIFNRTGESFAETRDAVRDYAEIETKWARDYIPLGGTFYALVTANIVVVLPVGVWLLHFGEIGLPTLLLFVILGANYSQPLLKLFNQFHSIAHLSMGSMLIGDILDATPQPDSRQAIALPNHNIAFENVSFGYSGHNVLHDVSFVARAGTVTALVGPSGSGKSTIASLIPRFWDVGAGRVTLGGADVREIGIDQLMDTVAFVFQNTFLFSDTIAANIRYGRPDASDAEVEAAARAARAHDFITALPDGYQTHLAEQGRTLSGGERQRLAIARAILKNSPVIVLDEATAFADPDNEAAIQEAIGELAAGKTLIVAAHRLHTIANADQILVIDKGSVVEIGTHDVLVAGNGLYASLWNDYCDTQSTALRPGDETRVEAAQ